MRTISRVFGTIIVILTFAACSESAELFASLDDASAVTVRTVAAGSVLAPGSSFSIELDYGDEEYQALTEVTLEIYDPEMTPVYTDIIDGADLENDLVATFEIPDLAQGPYRLVITGYVGQEIAFTDERNVFVLDPMPEISAIAIHPSAPAPGATALAVVELVFGDELVPYLRWQFSGETVTEGYLRDGTDQVQLVLPDEPGVYTVDVEFYPWGPEEGVDVTEPSIIAQSAEVFVGATGATGGETLPDDVILAWEFDGTIDAVGTNGEEADAHLDDTPSFTVLNGALGILVDSGVPVQVPVSIVPAHTGTVATELSISFGDAPRNAVFLMASSSLTLEAELIDQPRYLAIRAGAAGESVEGRLDLAGGESVEDIVIAITRSAEQMLIAIGRDAEGAVPLELVLPVADLASEENVPEDTMLLEPGILRFGGGETALGAIHRLAIRAASPDTMYRLEILRAIAARDDLQSPEITSIHIVTGRADAGESVADEETRSLVRSFRLPPASPVALLLAPGEGRARIPAENDVVIVRDALGYRLDTADESYSLGDGPVIVFELADQEGVRVLSPWTDIPSVPLGDPREDVSLEISAGALARIVQIEE